MNISLPEELARLVREKVASGRYASSSEVVREALRIMEKLDREEDERLQRLRKAWSEGVESGDFHEIDVDELKREARARAASKG